MANKKLNEFTAASTLLGTDLLAKANPTTGTIEKVTTTIVANTVISQFTSTSPNFVNKLWSGSQAEYDALTPDASTIYYIL